MSESTRSNWPEILLRLHDAVRRMDQTDVLVAELVKRIAELEERVDRLDEVDDRLRGDFESLVSRFEKHIAVMERANTTLAIISERVGWLLRLSNVLSGLVGALLMWLFENRAVMMAVMRGGK